MLSKERHQTATGPMGECGVEVFFCLCSIRGNSPGSLLSGKPVAVQTALRRHAIGDEAIPELSGCQGCWLCIVDSRLHRRAFHIQKGLTLLSKVEQASIEDKARRRFA
jgi:hypothetical protein